MAQQLARATGAGALIRRVAASGRQRGGGHGEVGFKEWFGPGDRDPTGVLFNETPPPPGQKRKWEDWELPYYLTGVLGTLILYVGFKAQPDTSLVHWAHRKAEQQLREEGILDD